MTLTSIISSGVNALSVAAIVKPPVFADRLIDRREVIINLNGLEHPHRAFRRHAAVRLREEKVAVVPGTAFGACGEGFLRISYAYSIEDLRVAIGRLASFIDKLRKEEDA